MDQKEVPDTRLPAEPVDFEQRDGFPAIDPAGIASPVLARLIEEVRNEEQSGIEGYNRFHNRHNR